MSLDEFDNAWVAELLFTVDAPTGVILDAAGEVESSLGVAPKDLVGLPLLAAIHRDDVASAQDAFDRTVEEGRATWEGRVLRSDGAFTEYGWEGRLSQDGRTIYARSRDVAAARKTAADLRIYERLADLTPDLFVVSNAVGRIVKVNESVCELHGVDQSQIVGSSLADFVTDEGRAVIESFPLRLANGESLINFQIPGIRGDGSIATVEGTATFDAVTNRWYVVERDVTERVAREAELAITQRFFDLSASQLVLLDAEDRVVRANRSFLDVADWELEEVEGRDILDVLGVVSGAKIRALLTDARNGHEVENIEVLVRVGDAARTFEIHFSAAVESGAVYLSCRDVTEERSLRAEMLHRAMHDPLTGLANRSSLHEAIESDLTKSDFVSVLMLDLDGFKKINDSLGHAAGDLLLIRIAERLTQRTRGVDMVARMGGDEFVILLRGVPDLATVSLVCDKITRAFREPFDLEGRLVDISASVGGTGGHGSSHTSEELLLEADLAAYSAKLDGADRYRVFDSELRSQADFTAAVEEHLRRVLLAPEFDLEVVEMKDRAGDQIGVGVIAPAVAISDERRWNQESLRIAKNLGLLAPISSRLTREAAQRLSPWLRSHPDCFLEIIYNAAEISMAGFATSLLGTLIEHDVDPHQFVVCLAGLDAIDAGEIDGTTVDALRAAGIRIALADSHADAHTLSVIAAIGVDRIDVDVARVAATVEGSVKRSITNTVLDIADRLGITVVVDASFTPDVVDVMSIFDGCSPLGVTYEVAVPVHEFIGPEGPVASVDEDADTRPPIAHGS